MSPRARCFRPLVLAALLLVVAPAVAVAETLLFAGSGSNLPILRVLAREYARVRPDVRIDVPGSIGSTGAVRAAADGAVTAGQVSRPLRDAERAHGLTVRPNAASASRCVRTRRPRSSSPSIPA
jgi:phosphate transport system substrate-binding protein